MYKSKLKILANTNQALKNAKVCEYVTKVTNFHHFWPHWLGTSITATLNGDYSMERRKRERVREGSRGLSVFSIASQI